MYISKRSTGVKPAATTTNQQFGTPFSMHLLCGKLVAAGFMPALCPRSCRSRHVCRVEQPAPKADLLFEDAFRHSNVHADVWAINKLSDRHIAGEADDLV